MKNFSIAIITMILLSFLSPVAAMQPKDDEVSVMTPVIIEFNDKVDKKLLENNGGKIKIEYKLRPAVAASLPPKAIENLRKNPNIKSIVNDIEIHTMEYGTSYFSDWGIKQIGADIVHNNGIKGETINVAVLDTGADLDHPDLVSNIAYSYDFSGSNDYDSSDCDGHGTHVAGTVGALLNGNGVVGVAPDVNLYILKVFTDGGRGSYSDVEEALEWCYLTHNDSDPNNDIQIVSMSLGSEYADGDPGFEDLVDTLYDAGILLVGAAGNSGSADDNVIYPARYENIIAVAATDINNKKASFSSTGPDVEISAPGVYVRSTYLSGGYAIMGGTSMATPHVAGTAALVMAANPGISNVEVRQILCDTAVDLGSPGRDNLYGFGLVDADEAAVPISTNQPPVAADDAYSVDEDTTLNIAASGVLGNDSDADGDLLTAVLVAGSINGNVSLNADGSFSYTPGANFEGDDNFTYRANDGTANSNVAIVTITVNPVNDAPVAADESYSVNEDTVLNVAVRGVLENDFDVDKDSLTAVLGTSSSNGILTLNSNGSFTYSPNANFVGTDSFTYKANDGFSDSNVATVSITVNPVNNAPVAVDDAYSVNEDTTLAVDAPGVLLNDTDAEGNPLSALLETNVIYGSLSLNADGSFTYIPNANFAGADSFTYKANDGVSDSNVATVSITVNQVNDAPVAADDAYSVNEDTILSVAVPGVLLNDVDSEDNQLTAVLGTSTSYGTLNLKSDGSFTYTPNANFAGADSFTYRANDGALNSYVATVSITVNPASPTVTVQSIVMSLFSKTAGKNKFTHATALVKVVDGDGNAVKGATVSGQWSGATSDSDIGITDASGQVSFDSDNVKNAGSGTTFTLTVKNVDFTGYTYDPSVTSASIKYYK